MAENEIFPQIKDGYINLLVDKVFKIIPMKEQNVETLYSYLGSLQIELIGIVPFLCNASIYSVIGTIQYLIDNDFDVKTCKKEVFKCISILNKLKQDRKEG